MNFHLASRGGVAINFDFPVGGGGGSCLNCSNKIIKKNSCSLRSLVFINISLIVSKAGR